MIRTIAHVNVARGFRGGERQTELLIRELEAMGVRQMLVARRGQPLAARVGETRTEVREVSGQIPGVIRALRGADLVHVHEGRSVYAAYLNHFLRRTAYVVTRRVDNPIKDSYFAHAAYRGAGAVVGVAPQVADIVRAFEPRAAVDVVQSASSGLAFDPDRVQSIREEFAGKFVVGHIGALDIRQKAQDVIVAAARLVETEHPELHFLLVGGGDDEEAIKEMARSLANVSFTGFVANVGDYLEAFDLLILPSRKEGIGSILLDAMEHRLAVVASRVGGVPNIVEDGRNGLLIEQDRPDALAAAILELYEQPALRKAFGERGAEVAKQFTARVMCEKYLRIYERLIGPLR